MKVTISSAVNTGVTTLGNKPAPKQSSDTLQNTGGQYPFAQFTIACVFIEQ